MQITFGTSENQKIKFYTKNASIIGSNGSGKSSLLRKIGLLNKPSTIISAHKNLTIKQGQFRAQDDTWLISNKSHFNNPILGDTPVPSDNNSVQNDFNQIIEIVFREYNDETVEAFNKGKTLTDINRKLDKVFKIWNSIFTDRKLLYKDKKIKVQIIGEEIYYDVENLSDGERIALYILLKVLLAEESSIIIIDEPETFLNPALLNDLFDECEKLKSKSTFIYLSHNLEFVTTRKNNTIFWIKEYKYPDYWIVSNTTPKEIPEELIVKVVGAKKQKILFVESDNNKDSHLYQLLYTDFKVWPVGSCKNVINYTKAFNSRTEKFDKQYFGLIDRDLQSVDRIASLETDKVFCIPIAIYENLFLCKNIVKFVFDHLGDSTFRDKFPKFEIYIKNKLSNDAFKLNYKKSQILKSVNLNIVQIAKGEIKFNPDSTQFCLDPESFKSKNHDEILQILNHKILKSSVIHLGFEWEDWRTHVLNIFNTEKANDLKKTFLSMMPEIK